MFLLCDWHAGAPTLYSQLEISVDASAGTTSPAITGGSWTNVLSGMLAALPLYAPLIWFAEHASGRRSQQQRLQQLALRGLRS